MYSFVGVCVEKYEYRVQKANQLSLGYGNQQEYRPKNGGTDRVHTGNLGPSGKTGQQGSGAASQS